MRPHEVDNTALDHDQTKCIVTDEHDLYEIRVLQLHELQPDMASRYVHAAVSSWGTDGFRCLQTYRCLMFMISSHLAKGTQSMSGMGTFCCLSRQGDHDDGGQCYTSRFSSLVICTGGCLILFSYIQIVFIYDCCIPMLLGICHVISSILTCWSPEFESSVKATVGRLKNIQIYMVFCTYTTTTLQFRFHHCCFIIRMHIQSF